MVLPQMRLDDLLTELQLRLEAVVSTRDRVHALLEAVVSIGSDLDLETVLRRIVEAATTLVDARYGALGVIGGDGECLAQFITVGISAEEIEAIGHWPHGHGILGLLIKKPQSLRLAEIAGDQESYGFPDHHPPMRRFLGVPIRVRDEVFGNLYLTEKVGGEEFDDEDEVVVSGLATAAGVAIENARLFQETCRRERWLEASSEISTALLSGTAPEEVIELVARRAREICDADLATVSLVDEATQELITAAADGEQAALFRGQRHPIEDCVSAPVYRFGRSLLLDDVQAAAPEGGTDGARDVPFGGARDRRFGGARDAPFGPALIVPLGRTGSVRGVLGVVNHSGRPAFNAAVLNLLEPFAAQAAIAMELAEGRRDAERLIVLEDRDRIAKDLHDTVIQRLFATAMTLMSAIKITETPTVTRRIQHAVDELDDTIRQIRSSIFALQIGPEQETLRSRIHQVADAASETLGFAPSVRLDGLLDTVVGTAAGEHLLAVLHEALSNIARHARAGHADIGIDVGDQLTLRVQDDGVGISEGGRRSGLKNMADRAASLGGSFHARRRDEGGTILVWRVPVR